MKKLYYCIRCHSLRDDHVKFNARQITSIWLLREAGIEFDIKREVCETCRQGIGDEIADKMLCS